MNDSSWQDLDDCFQIQLPYSKIRHALFLGPARVLVIYGANLYSILDIMSRSETKVVKEGKLPHRVQEIRRVSQSCVLLGVDNSVSVFDLMGERRRSEYEIGRSEVYSESFGVEMVRSQEQCFVLFWKSSALRSSPITVYYEIHLLEVTEGDIKKIRKLRVQYPEIRKFGLFLGQIFSYQLKGYSVEVTFVESHITHRIESIYPLFLLSVSPQENFIMFDFTHQELEGEVASYAVSKEQVRKPVRKARRMEAHTVQTGNNRRSLVFKNWLNRNRKDPKVGIVKVTTEKSSKYVHLMERVVPGEASVEFKQTVLALLK